MPLDPHDVLKNALCQDDAPTVARLFEEHPEFKPRINDPLGPFDSPIIIHARSPGMLDVLLAAGADINAKSRWWAGGFGLLHSADPELCSYAIRRGATVDAHAASRLGLFDLLRELVRADPSLVHARGGDGQTPLHFASSVAVAEYLLENGADIDARDIDHESTPAQYMIQDRQQIARYLVEQGCQTDLLMLAALGDLDRVRGHLDAAPEAVRTRINDESFPKTNPRAGGTIYQWTLGRDMSAHDVARKFGHDPVYRLLMERSPAEVKLLAACWAGDEEEGRAILAGTPGLVARLSAAERRQVAHAARNNDARAVKAMLNAGLPIDATGQHGGTALHWAAFHGNLELVKEILRREPPLELPDTDYNATPLGWAIHGSTQGWYRERGEYARTVEALLAAGAKLPSKSGGSEEVQAVLRTKISAG